MAILGLAGETGRLAAPWGKYGWELVRRGATEPPKTGLSEKKAAMRLPSDRKKQTIGRRTPRPIACAKIASRQSDLALALQAQQHSANDEQQPARRLRDVVGAE